MDSRERLNLIARVTYYLGWLLLIIGGLVHAGLGKAFFQSIGLPQRNLFEAGVALFLICAASSLRALNQAKWISEGQPASREGRTAESSAHQYRPQFPLNDIVFAQRSHWPTQIPQANTARIASETHSSKSVFLSVSTRRWYPADMTVRGFEFEKLNENVMVNLQPCHTLAKYRDWRPDLRSRSMSPLALRAAGQESAEDFWRLLSCNFQILP
jgi:hypothetical protein